MTRTGRHPSTLLGSALSLPKGQGLRCLFRIAAGPRIGFGHLMRARALARALGVRPLVALRGGAAAVRAAKRMGCRVVNRDGFARLGADVVIVDDPSPAQAERWLALGRRHGIPTVAVRDHGVGSVGADLVVDGSIGRTPRGTARGRLDGPAFSILDPGFARAVRTGRRNGIATRVLIALGGGEHVGRLAGRLVHAIKQQSADASIRVAAGLCAEYRKEIAGATWIVGRLGLRSELQRCDVAVVAGGVTLYEACALGRATVAVPVVPGQRRAVRAAASRGAVVGFHGSAAAAAVGSEVASLLGDARRRRALGSAGRRLVDGRGALRVASRIAGLVAETKGRYDHA